MRRAPPATANEATYATRCRCCGDLLLPLLPSSRYGTMTKAQQQQQRWAFAAASTQPSPRTSKTLPRTNGGLLLLLVRFPLLAQRLAIQSERSGVLRQRQRRIGAAAAGWLW